MSKGKEQFERLCHHIRFEEEIVDKEVFFQGEILNVRAYPQEKIYAFKISFPKLLNIQTYQLFVKKIAIAFKNVAKTKVEIIVPEDATFSLEEVESYWRVLYNQTTLFSPICKAEFEQAKLTLEGKKVTLTLTNESIRNFVEERYKEKITRSFIRAGFIGMTTQIHVDSAAEETLMEDFHENKKAEEKINQILEEERIIENLLAEQEEKEQEAQTPQKQPEPVEKLPEVEVIKFGKPIGEQETVTPMVEAVEETTSIVMEGFVFDCEIKVTRAKKKILEMKVTDYTSSFKVTRFSFSKLDEAIFEKIAGSVSAKKGKGIWVRMKGKLQIDQYSGNDLTMMLKAMQEIPHGERQDYAKEGEKRVELHLHTNYSTMDAVDTPQSFVNQAIKWGHKAIAITDHAGAQAYPEAHGAARGNDIKIIYGQEAYVIDEDVPIAYNNSSADLRESRYVVFDIETTSLSAVYGKIIQIAGVKMYKGNVEATFERYIDPGFPLSKFTTYLTGITDDDVSGSLPLEETLKDFKEFCKDSILVAHNGTFDVGYLDINYERFGLEKITEPWFDTLEFARNLYPEMKRFGLGQLTKKFKISLGDNHHNAIYDSQATGHLAWLFVREAIERFGVKTHQELNEKVLAPDAYKRARPFHATIYAKNQEGLRDLFKAISEANTTYFEGVPRLPRHVLDDLRKNGNLIVGSSCREGEVFTAMAEKGYEKAKEVAKYYDFLEIMPPAIYAPQIFDQLFTEQELQEVLENITKLGQELDKPVVATGNAHYVNQESKVYREIIIRQLGFANPLNRAKFRDDPNSLPPMPDVHFRTTDEMLHDFDFLGEEKAYEVVVKNTNMVADWFDEITPVKTDLYTPEMENVEENLTSLTYQTAMEIYGEDLPEIVEKRIEKELYSIIGNGFSVVYWISRELVHRSNQRGYLVGSRGSVGSSFVATMTGITEVNPLPPHYVCTNCHYTEFYDDGTYGSGYDMPEKSCPNCGQRLHKDGQDIPFETFLGFHGDKVPDIDLNFSGEDQANAHLDCRDIFGEDYAFRAGTIATVADKTAYGFVLGYEEEKHLHLRSAEKDRLALGASGVKRTTGQHPGGIIVIPGYMDVYDFSPIQYPADKVDAEWRTTHFDFHSIHDNVLKLDILGHVDPTMIRTLQDLSGIEPKTIPVDDPEVMKIFGGTSALGVTEEQIDSKTGTFGIPEFGTKFVRGMLEGTRPSTFAELLQISGLSHGTDVWLGNAEELIKDGTANLASVIGCRDDIMVYLMHRGLEASLAFKIMESVRKGKGIPDEWQAEMRKQNIPEWYIESCLKIKYMFPKAHAAAYVLMALRVAYFKVHHPIIYYCAYFSHRANDFDLKAMTKGLSAVKARMEEIKELVRQKEATKKEENTYEVLELVNEMLERGMEFSTVDLYRSEATEFVIDGNALIPPFSAVDGLGDNVAQSIVEARKSGEFLSKQELRNRTGLSTTLVEKLDELGSLKGMPEENQLSLFDF